DLFEFARARPRQAQSDRTTTTSSTRQQGVKRSRDGASKTRVAHSQGQHEYTLPPGVAATSTQFAGVCWYVKSSRAPSAEGECGSPPHETAYSFGAQHDATPATRQ